jgi:hypothetical protein
MVIMVENNPLGSNRVEHFSPKVMQRTGGSMLLSEGDSRQRSSTICFVDMEQKYMTSRTWDRELVFYKIIAFLEKGEKITCSPSKRHETLKALIEAGWSISDWASHGNRVDVMSAAVT